MFVHSPAQFAKISPESGSISGNVISFPGRQAPLTLACTASQDVYFGSSQAAAKPAKTGITATLGPKTDSPEMIKKLIEAGVDIFRLNFSHGTQDDHGKRIGWIRDAVKELESAGKLDHSVKILADIQGPKIRVGRFAAGTMELTPGKLVQLTRELTTDVPDTIPVTLPEMIDALQPGHKILMDDGKLELIVSKSAADNGGKVQCTVVRGGTLRNSKGMNLPDVKLNIPAISTKDEADIAYAVSKDVDWLAVSFVRNPQDIADARKQIKAHGKNTPIMAKIEKPEAIQEENLRQIVSAADGVMVARGDLGIEVDIVEMPRLQELILKEAKAQNKPVVVATQMLESMMTSTIPSRSDVSDIADAVKDGADYVMLSGETAMGDYPVEAVTLMNRLTKKYSGEHNGVGASFETKIINKLKDLWTTCWQALTKK